MSVNVREAALNSLLRCEKDGKYSNLELDSAIKKYNLTGVDRSFFTTLVYGVIEKRIALDYIISVFSSRPVDSLNPFIVGILRLGAYQILYLDRTPDSAAVNEAVESAKKRANVGAASYVNAVLRKISANSSKPPMPDKKDGMLYWSIKYSLPEWLCAMWFEYYGEERAIDIMEGVNRRAKTSLFINTLKSNREELLAKFSGIAEASADSDFGIIMKKDIPINDLPIADGLCFVQDISSQLCVKELSPCPGDFLIDTCCCPGGKSFAAAVMMKNQGKILSLDLHENKLSLVRHGAENLGIDIIETIAHDSSSAIEEFIGKADRVICDVPCSGLGVIAKKPDLRYKSQSDIERLPELQYRILSASASYVKNGGTLLYSTCTLNKKENENVISRFLDEHLNYRLETEKTVFPASDRDGFYFARMTNANEK